MNETVSLTEQLFKDTDIICLPETGKFPVDFEIVIKTLRANPLESNKDIANGLIRFYKDRRFTINEILGHNKTIRLSTGSSQPTEEDFQSFSRYISEFQPVGAVRFVVETNDNGCTYLSVFDEDNKEGASVSRVYRDGTLISMIIKSKQNPSNKYSSSFSFRLFLNSYKDTGVPVFSDLEVIFPGFSSKYYEQRIFDGNEEGSSFTYSAGKTELILSKKDVEFEPYHSSRDDFKIGCAIIFQDRNGYETYKAATKYYLS